MCRFHIDSITLVCRGRVDRGGMGRSAILSSLFLDDLFNQGDDRVGPLLLR